MPLSSWASLAFWILLEKWSLAGLVINPGWIWIFSTPSVWLFVAYQLHWFLSWQITMHWVPWLAFMAFAYPPITRWPPQFWSISCLWNNSQMHMDSYFWCKASLISLVSFEYSRAYFCKIQQLCFQQVCLSFFAYFQTVMHFFCTGPPFAGFLYDTYKIWHYTFGLGGLFIVLSGLLLLILPCFRQAKLLQTQFNKRRASTSATISIPCSNGNPGPVSVWIRIVISSNNMLRTRQHVVPHFMVSYIARILWYVILHTSAEIYYYTSFSRLHTHTNQSEYTCMRKSVTLYISGFISEAK